VYGLPAVAVPEEAGADDVLVDVPLELFVLLVTLELFVLLVALEVFVLLVVVTADPGKHCEYQALLYTQVDPEAQVVDPV